MRGGEFSKDYRSVYLFTPPEIFSYSHLPEQRRWQLREQPLSRGEFVRQPQLPPTFFAVGFRLVAPDRSHVTVSERFAAQLENPRGRFVIADIRAPGQPRGERCEVRGGALVEVDCRLPASGTWDVRLFEHAARYGSFEWIGSFVAAGGR